MTSADLSAAKFCVTTARSNDLDFRKVLFLEQGLELFAVD